MNARKENADILPRDIEAEKTVLGALLVEPELFSNVAATMQVDDFSLEAHRRIFRQMLDLDKLGERIDRVLIAGKLRDAGLLEVVGGMTYLCELDGSLGSVMGLDGYCTRLREKAIARTAIVSLTKLQEELAVYSDNAAFLGKAQKVIDDLASMELGKINGFRSAADVICERGGFDQLFGRKRDAIPTPWFVLDQLLGGGLHDTELIILAARPSIGKTAAALQFARAAAASGKVPAVYSLEMDNESLITRMTCGLAQLDSNFVRQGLMNREEREKLRDAANQIANLPILYDDTNSCTLAAIDASLKQTIAQQRARGEAEIGMVIIDYLQLMEVIGKSENRNQEVSYITRGLKKLARALNIPFLVLSQLKRLENENKEPGLSDLRDSGSIEQDADVVMFLHADPRDMNPIRDTKLILAKQRNGPVAVVPMIFDRRTTLLTAV